MNGTAGGIPGEPIKTGHRKRAGGEETGSNRLGTVAAQVAHCGNPVDLALKRHVLSFMQGNFLKRKVSRWGCCFKP
jgi:hypothetical protein